MAAQPKRYRWVCPECGDGHLAPGRPRKLDVRRFCLPCSSKKKDGLLIERTCPALERERAESTERSKAKAERKRKAVAKVEKERKAAHKAKTNPVVCGIHVRREMVRQIERGKVVFRGIRPGWVLCRVSWSRRATYYGRGGPDSGITIYGHNHTDADQLRETILHELVHVKLGNCADPNDQRATWHGETFKRTLAEAAREVFGVDVGWADSYMKISDDITRALREKTAARAGAPNG